MPGPHGAAALRGPAVAAPAELRSFISPREQNPAAAGRLRARIAVPEREGGITFLATAPCSPLAGRPLPLLLRGPLRARRAQVKLPWPAAGSSPCPAAPRGQEQPGRRSPKPAAAATSRFSFSFFPFSKFSSGTELCGAANVKSGRKCRNRRAPYRSAVPRPARPRLLPFPAPPRRQQWGEEAERARQPGPAPGRREGWLLSLALLPAV